MFSTSAERKSSDNLSANYPNLTQAITNLYKKFFPGAYTVGAGFSQPK
ncbi:hypothetical protein VL20_1151 [Microcystis panniformis FACHB-1757]|uniref:Uncharacterized protein n=1 Tax=Microcystis panniformis FACHB-1757 TaxID=1638788 RepID=A0A0K1RWP2_9CHRO|nr:hypothetical protein VL20_1151 [Microcystis panniformis FACHB-1757]